MANSLGLSTTSMCMVVATSGFRPERSRMRTLILGRCPPSLWHLPPPPQAAAAQAHLLAGPPPDVPTPLMQGVQLARHVVG